MDFPLALLRDGVLTVFYGPAPFTYGTGDDAIDHPAADLAGLTAEQWAIKCPDWERLSVIDTPPAPDDTKVITRLPEAAWTLTDDGLVVTYSVVAKPAEQIEAEQAMALAILRRQYGAAVQRHLDAPAIALDYESILSIISYAGSKNAKYRLHAQVMGDWRDDVWTKVDEIQDAVIAGRRSMPTEAGLLAELPPLVWPA